MVILPFFEALYFLGLAIQLRIHAVHADEAHICASMRIAAHVKILMCISHIQRQKNQQFFISSLPLFMP